MLGTKTYGAEGKETIDTRKELAFALREKKGILVLKMTDFFAEPYAIMQLPSLQSIEWAKGQPLPQAAVEFICNRVQRDETIAKKISTSSRSKSQIGKMVVVM